MNFLTALRRRLKTTPEPKTIKVWLTCAIISTKTGVPAAEKILGNLKKTRAAGRTDSDDVYDAWAELMKKFLTRMADKENLQIISPLDEIDDLEIDIANGA